MNSELQNLFQSIESLSEPVTLLAATITKAKQEVETNIAREELNPSRRLDAFRVALYNLNKLELDINRSRRLLNDLRTLRRLLFAERTGVSALSTSIERKDSQGVAAA